MGVDPEDGWASAEITDSLVGRKAGSSAHDRARELRAEKPISSFLGRMVGAHTDERAWRKGAAGERATAFWLGRLPSEWQVFHDVPVGNRGANIDHVVIGPGGVFTVNAKNLSGKVAVYPRSVLVNGHRTDYLPKAAREAERASRLLSAALGRTVPVTGILAIIADDWHVRERPVDVFVGPPRGVKNWIKSRPATLSTRDVAEICSAASRPSTWA